MRFGIKVNAPKCKVEWHDSDGSEDRPRRKPEHNIVKGRYWEISVSPAMFTDDIRSGK
jgi:hypothetical protein